MKYKEIKIKIDTIKEKIVQHGKLTKEQINKNLYIRFQNR